MTDIIVVGGGVIGLSIAYELAGQGIAVKVIERGAFGREASWAGAGMLPPGNVQRAPDAPSMLRAVSHALWPELSARLRDETGIDNGFRQTGCIALKLGEDEHPLREEIDCWQREGVIVDELTPAALAELEPAVTRCVTSAYRLPDMCQVRNPRHLKALLAGCAARGVELLAGQPVVGFEWDTDGVVSVRTPDDEHRAGRYCMAGGAWTRQLVAGAGFEILVQPVRGQIVLLSTNRLPFKHMLQLGARYIVPRPDGRVLIGSTEEDAGFDKRTTAGAARELLAFAVELVPALAGATCERFWAGLRPGSADGLPYLGKVPGARNLYIAAGHFRSGLQTSPGTALAMRELMMEQELSVPLDAFACDRHGVVRSVTE